MRGDVPTNDEPESPAAPAEETVLARLDRPRAPETARIAVVADPHVATETAETWKAFHRTEANLRRAVAAIQHREVDGLVVAGDLTKDGEPWNFDRYDELVASIDLPTVTLPGNHDVPKAFDDHDALPFDSFRDRYAGSGGYPVRTRMGPIDVIGLNSAHHPDGSLRDTFGGRVSESQLETLDSMLADCETPLVALHHNLYPLPDNPGGRWTNFPLDDGEELRATLREHGVPLVVSGHQHVPALGVRDGVHELIAPAVCSYPHAVLLIEIGPDGTTVKLIPLASPSETVESYRLGTDGVPMGRGIVNRTERRLTSLPLDPVTVEK